MAPPASTVLLALSLILLITLATMPQAHSLKKLRLSDCKPKCKYRCSATSHKKPCMFYCQKCCRTCRCVPPGVYGHKQLCACYNNWKTKEGRPKCP